MNGQSIDESISLENLTWSLEEFTLSDFVDKFPLPQIVKVQEGYYGPDEDSCLGADQILFLHTVKHTEKVQARDRRKRYLHIPLNCSQKVELRPSNLKDVYESVADLVKALKDLPKFVRVTQGYYNMEDDNVCINPGDKLKLLRVVPGDQDDYLVVENQDRSGFPIRIPMTANAAFQPLSDGLEYYLKEATSMAPIPFFFQFIDPPKLDAIGEPSVFNSTLGVLRVEKTYQDDTVICTTKEGSCRTVVSCPKQLQITVAAANGALIGDSDYVRVCRFFHDGVSLKRIENMEAYNVFASRDTIREYVYDTPKVPASPSTPDKTSTLDDVIPPRPNKDQATNEASKPGAMYTHDDDDDGDNESHDYTYIDDAAVNQWADKNKFDYTSFKKSFEQLEVEGNKNDTVKDAQDEESIEKEQKESTKNDSVKLSKDGAHIKNGILFLEKTKPPLVKPKPAAEGKPWEKKEDTGHKASAASEPISGAKDTNEGGPTTEPVSTPASAASTDLSSLTIDGVSRFLEKHHLAEFAEAFKYNEVDGDMLVSLDTDMMEALGMNPFQRKKLKKLIGGWRPKI